MGFIIKFALLLVISLNICFKYSLSTSDIDTFANNIRNWDEIKNIMKERIYNRQTQNTAFINKALLLAIQVPNQDIIYIETRVKTVLDFWKDIQIFDPISRRARRLHPNFFSERYLHTAINILGNQYVGSLRIILKIEELKGSGIVFQTMNKIYIAGIKVCMLNHECSDQVTLKLLRRIDTFESSDTQEIGSVMKDYININQITTIRDFDNIEGEKINLILKIMDYISVTGNGMENVHETCFEALIIAWFCQNKFDNGLAFLDAMFVLHKNPSRQFLTQIKRFVQSTRNDDAKLEFDNILYENRIRYIQPIGTSE